MTARLSPAIGVPAPRNQLAEPVEARTRRPAVGWLLAALLLVGTAVALRRYEVPLPTTFVFAAYIGLGVSLPGTLLWRTLGLRRASLVEDVAAGTALGYAIEVLVYLAGRAIDRPMLTFAWPVVVMLGYAALPSLRARVREPGGEVAPRWWPWAMFGSVGFIVGYGCLSFFRASPISSPRFIDPDSQFQLALAGELKHHVPPSIPWLHGEPLHYHWFVHAEVAATSWATGIEPDLLLYRLAPLPFLAAFVVLIAALARRLSGAWWAGPVAVGMTFLVQAPNPYGWSLGAFGATYGFGVVEDGGLLRPTMWDSPTQTFGGLISVLLVIVVTDLLRVPDAGRRPGAWVLVALSLVTVMGAKATYVPLLLCGALLVLVWHGVTRRALHGPALGLTLMVAAVFAFAQLVLFGGANQALSFAPLATMTRTGIGEATGFVAEIDPVRWRLALITGICVVCWLCVWAGLGGLARARQWARLELVFLLGIGLAGVGALSAFGHPGLAQYFFMESARPYLCVLAAVGFVALLGPHPRRWTVVAVGLAVAAGAGVVWLVRWIDGPAVPTVDGARTGSAVALAIVWPYVAILGAVGLAGLGLYLHRRRWPTVVLLVAATVTGLGLPSGLDILGQQTLTHPNAWQTFLERLPPVTDGTLEAGRWLREHSSPDDLVATNVHCRSPTTEFCSNLHFSVAAYTERRVLLESWGYTDSLYTRALDAGLPVWLVPFWDQDLMQTNDVVFAAPSAQNVAALRDRYGVRWLFADEAGPPPATADLAAYAVPRFRAGKIAVYEVGR